MDAQLTTLVQSLATKLQQMQLKLATAESCTGGWISQALTSLPGSSNWFEGGIVSYSNAIKCNLLGVSQQTLEQYGAVSLAVVEEMATGVALRLATPLSVSVSGIAGPGGGTDSKPVGTVCIGWHINNLTSSALHHFDGTREQVRQKSVVAALEGVVQRLKDLEYNTGQTYR